MEQESITVAGTVDTFLALLIGIGPKLALVPFLGITASLDPGDEAARAAQDAGHRGTTGRL
jgi:hypothetical protein